MPSHLLVVGGGAAGAREIQIDFANSTSSRPRFACCATPTPRWLARSIEFSPKTRRCARR